MKLPVYKGNASRVLAIASQMWVTQARPGATLMPILVPQSHTYPISSELGKTWMCIVRFWMICNYEKGKNQNEEHNREL
jgi:hypothetical protein